MATKASTTSAFIAQLLAPLPAGEKQARDRSFIREMTADRRLAWDAQESVVNARERQQDLSWAMYRACEDKAEARSLLAVHYARVAQYEEAMADLWRTPSPSHAEMRRKRKWSFYFKQPGVAEVYAADEAWLGPVPEKTRKPKKVV